MEHGSCTVEQRAEGPVVRIVGEVDLSNYEERRAILLTAVAAAFHGMVLDLRETTYLDSSGVRMMFELAEKLQRQGRQLVLVVGDEDIVRRVMVLTQLDEVVPIVETVDAAIDVLTRAA